MDEKNGSNVLNFFLTILGISAGGGGVFTLVFTYLGKRAELRAAAEKERLGQESTEFEKVTDKQWKMIENLEAKVVAVELRLGQRIEALEQENQELRQDNRKLQATNAMLMDKEEATKRVVKQLITKLRPEDQAEFGINPADYR